MHSVYQLGEREFVEDNNNSYGVKAEVEFVLSKGL